MNQKAACVWLERLKMGGNFFIIQIGIVIIFSTDNVLVSNLISSAEVTEYSSITRVVVTFLSIWYLVINPASYRVSEYLEKNDYNKLKGLILKLNKSLTKNHLITDIGSSKSNSLFSRDQLFTPSSP